ncbi:helix-turn-helix domain-containing protein [Gordonia hankookensis]|uniref:Helix-turn-helix domain-containing protein n=1 Tax=Gordonia hankookensis TaxID=589403 RepID=A0ABR7W6Z8_9ACTN|nr:helix-turn-helix domain-containing protein [Gordonia hankookensis]
MARAAPATDRGRESPRAPRDLTPPPGCPNPAPRRERPTRPPPSGLQLPRAERQATVIDLRQRGLSQQAIADAVGVSQSTIRDDLSTSSVETTELPDRATGIDGKAYPAHPSRSAVGGAVRHCHW